MGVYAGTAIVLGATTLPETCTVTSRAVSRDKKADAEASSSFKLVSIFSSCSMVLPLTFKGGRLLITKLPSCVIFMVWSSSSNPRRVMRTMSPASRR